MAGAEVAWALRQRGITDPAQARPCSMPASDADYGDHREENR
jgi:hypothetical protein